MGTPSCETLADSTVSCPQNLAGPSDSTPCGTRSPALSAYRSRQPRSSPIRSVKSLVADSPSTSRFTTPVRKRPCGRQPLDIQELRTANRLVADSPSIFTAPHRKKRCDRQPLVHSRTREATQAVWPSGMPRCKNPPARKGKLGQAQRHRRVVQYLRKRVSCATISVTHSGKSSGRLAQRERRCLTSTRSQVQILYRPPLKPQVRRFLSGLFFFRAIRGL